MKAQGASGFTLLEVLVALVVLGLVLAGLGQGTQFGLRAWSSQSRLLARSGEIDAVDRLLRGLIEQADPGTASVAARISGGPASLSVLTVMASQEAEVAIGVDAGRRLVLRALPGLHGTVLQARPPPVETVLLTSVARVDIAYWGRDSGSSAAAAPRSWHASWTGPSLPDLIRVQVVFAPGDGRYWPPIVAAPMRAKPS